MHYKTKVFCLTFLACFMAFFFLQYCTSSKPSAKDIQLETDTLLNGFVTLPDSTKPFIYWYWISDNISREGITKDLEAMAEVGIGTAFIGNIGLDDQPYGNVKVLTKEWWNLTEHAIREAKRIGVNIGMFNSPGWSQSGGPWVKPAEAMRYLISSETKIKGGQMVNIILPQARDTFQDVKVLAYPQPLLDGRNISVMSPVILVNGQTADTLQALVDNLYDKEISIPVKDRTATIDIRVNKPYLARSIAIHPSAFRFRCQVEVKALIEGKFKTISHFDFDRSNDKKGVAPIPLAPVAIALPLTESTHFQLVFSRTQISGKAKDRIALTEITLSPAPVLERFIEKQLAVMYQTPLPYWKEYQWQPQASSGTEAMNVSAEAVLDISDRMQPDGTLKWNAPPGDWIINRIGLSPTGTKNSPTSPEAQGLEVDKMSKKYLANHFDAYVGELLRRMPAADRTAFKYVVADSYEVGPENWTEGFQQDFIDRFHYDPVPYLPVITGRIINSADHSDRFLWDLRRLIADKIAYQYVGGLRELCEKNGLRVWLENYGHWGFPSEFLMYGGQSHEIGGEFWNEGTLGDVECKAASSAAHIYGINRVYAESFTASAKGFERDPAYLKKRGDWSFTEGINHVLLHVYIHQPYEDKFPGMNAWFGTEFNRKNTWFTQSKSWIEYQRRCMYMLQQGKPVSDVCYFIGEDAPKMTGIREPELPKGYSFDYINAEVIINKMRVKDGVLELPGGMSYKMMVLPPLKTMRPELLKKISELVDAGAIILGPKPERSPSLQDFPSADNEVKRMASILWGNIDGKKITARRYGKGLVLDGIDMQQALDQIKLQKDFDMDANIPVLFTHRSSVGREIYFITNQSDTMQNFTATFRVNGMQPELWDATNGTARLLPNFTIKNGTTSIPMQLTPAQSCFIVFRKKADQDQGGENFPKGVLVQTLINPWTITFNAAMGGPKKPVMFKTLADWTSNENDSIKYYSGTAVYETNFSFKPDKLKKYLLDLGEVKNLARIKVNKKDVGGLWMAPWQVDITPFLQQGNNNLEIEVVNLWVNRLIGDARLPEAERKTWLSVNMIRKTDPLHPSGLLGPVSILQLNK